MFAVSLTITIIFSTIFCHIFLQRYNEVTKQLIEENTQDPLTGLLNRRGFNLQFNHELNKAITQSKSLCLLLIDVDHFKKINDQHGHDIGDACLIEVGNVLTSNIRKNDIIARFGGEEFTIILPNTDLASARKVAEKLNKSISDKVFSELKLPLTITLGLTSLHGPQDNELKMIKRADKALYKGKDNGRNCVEILE